MAGTTLAHRPSGAPPSTLALAGENPISTAMEELKSIRTFVAAELKEGVDFGVIPGTGTKPTLLLPGAQKIGMYFNAAPTFVIERLELGEGHVEIVTICKLTSRTTDRVICEGVGSCSTMEKKYRYRGGARVCPECGKESIIQTKKGRNPGGYWCVPDKSGCGANFNPGDPAIEGQEIGKVPNPDIHDARNTVLKMSMKRAQVSAAHNLGCMSELFTQDLEDTYDMRPAASSPPEDPRGPKPTVTPDRPEPSRESVNQAFKPTPKPPAPTQGVNPFREYVTALAAEANAEFKGVLTRFGIEPNRQTDVTGLNRLMNFIVSDAIEKGVVEADKVGKLSDLTKRDASRAWACAEWLYREYPERVEEIILAHLTEKRASGLKHFKVVDDDEADPELDAVLDAVDGKRHREPGED